MQINYQLFPSFPLADFKGFCEIWKNPETLKFAEICFT